MQKIQLKVKKLLPEAKLPAYGSEFAAGADLYALSENPIRIAPQETAIVHTGLAVEIPEGYVGLVFARSGLATKKGLAPANKVGVIDSDYRGELRVALYNHTKYVQTVEPFERVAQFVIMPYVAAQFEEAEELSDTVRGEGGFGSTGTK
ncbi:MAG TPA: dUTP diphosphatase [Candidatus Borkfalkia faecipullorum]|mgnify:FL=1|uniref:dUTP diphosphatase n=1 Tax=Candidatus Borkfalkia faecipullorum TaxID=2838510 RepID=A0A9D1V8Q0_9FIRM|nr:dUTP diphosphatase [Candidatus Borkfalkia faecipullorum]